MFACVSVGLVVLSVFVMQFIWNESFYCEKRNFAYFDIHFGYFCMEICLASSLHYVALHCSHRNGQQHFSSHPYALVSTNHFDVNFFSFLFSTLYFSWQHSCHLLTFLPFHRKRALACIHCSNNILHGFLVMLFFLVQLI